MCRTCGCDTDMRHRFIRIGATSATPLERLPETRKIRIEHDLLAKNDALAEENREYFEREHIVVLNLIGSPGAGKTALLEALIRTLKSEFDLAVLEGDQATALDAARIERAGCRVLEINTGPGCHLDARMVAEGVRELPLRPGSVLFIENVGNLVCPALFDLGESAKLVVMSVTEGEDKPLKYPHVFRAADLFVLSKIDLLPHVSFDEGACLEHARSIHPELESLRISARTGAGIATLSAWVRERALRSFQPIPA